ncbi:MAG: glycoside hydrolase family 5 protein [Lachnospiraceae bacterium]|nr:glycoside hydrolase family 5 protein [Lachnospiraceae bacterium]
MKLRGMGSMKKDSKRIIIIVAILVVFVLVLGCVSIAEGLMIKHYKEKQKKSTAIKVASEEYRDNCADGVSVHGRLRLEDGSLKDENGDVMWLRGMSSHGIMWYPQYTSFKSIRSTRDYGANVFRIAMYTENPDTGYNVNSATNTGIMYSAIENVKANDMYAVVDWHVLEDANPLKYVENAKNFFGEISKHYGNDPAIIYEICNEPNGETTWDDILNYANQVIPVIRENAPDAVIIVGTPGYCYNFGLEVYRTPVPFDNIMYAFHFYAGLHDDRYEKVFEGAKKAGLAVCVSEWGIGSEDMQEGATKEALALGRNFSDYLRENKISFMAWSLSNKDEVYSAIKKDCHKLSAWKKEDLTDVGEVLFDSLKQ